MTRKRHHDNLPTFDELIVPTLKALVDPGGSGIIAEINERVDLLRNYLRG